MLRSLSVQNSRLVVMALVLFLLILLNIHNYILTSSSTSSSASLLTTSNSNSLVSIRAHRLAVLYAAPTFHDEVVSSIACMLHDLGYFVVAYIGSGIEIGGGVILPFSEARKASSDRFYGRCVSQWVTITSRMKLPENPAISVFVTYPMLTHGGVLDKNALKIIEKLADDPSQCPLVMVTHRSNEMFHSILLYLQRKFSLSRDRLVFLFLGEHTYHNAFEQLQFYSHLNVSDAIPDAIVLMNHSITAISTQWKAYFDQFKPQFEYIYPVMPTAYVVDNRSSSSLRYDSIASQLLSWYSSLSPEIPPPSSANLRQDRGGFSGQGIKFAMQGNFGGKHSFRKDPWGVVQCLRSLETKLNSQIHLYLIGKINGEVNIHQLQYGEIKFFSGLDSKSYYSAIAQSDYMITALADREYYTTRATSSVPAALISDIPLVTSAEFLAVYPCLRDQPIHRRISMHSDCESMEAAAMLSSEEYQQAKQEMKNCSQIFWEAGKRTLTRILEHKSG